MIHKPGNKKDVIFEEGELTDISSLSSPDHIPPTSPFPSLSLDSSPLSDMPACHSAMDSLLSEVDLIPDVVSPLVLFHDDNEMERVYIIDPGMEYVASPAWVGTFGAHR